MNNINLRQTLKSQIGASMGSILFNVGILIFIGFSVSKVAVFYFENNTINNSLQDLKNVAFVTKKSKTEVVDILRKKFQANNISLSKDEVIVDKKSDRLIVNVVYERRVNMFSNIDVVVSFKNHFETVNN